MSGRMITITVPSCYMLSSLLSSKDSIQIEKWWVLYYFPGQPVSALFGVYHHTLDKEDDLVFQFGGNVYINTLSVKLRLKVVTTGYRAQNISNFNTTATHYDVLSLLWNETVGTMLYPSMRKKTVSCQFFLSLQIIANQTTTRYLHTSLTMIPIVQ